MQKRKQRELVTVVVGLICNNAVVLASDSQTADVETGRTIRNVAKIFKVEFADGNTGLLAQSGHDDTANNVVEIILEKAKETPLLVHPRSFAELVEDAVGSLKRRLRKQFVGTDLEFQKHCLDYNFELMTAHYFKDQPQVFTVSFVLGLANRARSEQPYAIIGCGAELAKFFLDRLDIPDMQLGEAIASAIYTVEEVKKSDLRCSGPTKAAYTVLPKATSPSRSTMTAIVNREEVEEWVQKLIPFDKKIKAEWKRGLTEMVYGVAKEIVISESGLASSPSLTGFRVDTANEDKK